ncbi:MAG: hypothetical protein B7C54_11875 [Acidimicrobiales bacterium mtb01]|nr:MAG: hypothetical protein B7C54_11875 [Acidimicrobiales bacterium mtb01]
MILEDSSDDAEARSRVAAPRLQNADKVPLTNLDARPCEVLRCANEIGPEAPYAIVRHNDASKAPQYVKVRRSIGARLCSTNRGFDVELGHLRLGETTNSLAGT